MPSTPRFCWHRLEAVCMIEIDQKDSSSLRHSIESVHEDAEMPICGKVDVS